VLSAVRPPVTVRVPAKINLHLAVGDTRPDGYHDLVTVFQALNMFDEVSVVAAHAARPSGAAERLATIGAGAPGVELLGDVTDDDRASVPVDSSNLAWRAAVALAGAVGREPDVRIGLRKAIPVAGGMAGGSADAAGALLALASLWRLDLGRDALMEIAATVGSDVAFALHGGTALGTGRGESLVPVLSRHTFHWVVALQDHGLSTPTVFSELDRLRAVASGSGGSANPLRRAGNVEPVLEAVASGEARALALLLGNDLQAAAVSLDPGLRRTLRAGVSAGALAGVVSGSGPTCVFLCTDGPSAVRVAAELAGAGVCRTVRVAHGPVPGARVIDGDPTRPPRGPGGPPAGDPGPNMYA
jgi:4-diphosphocytidyl-2-C-methyl-D-erythritol kinase